MNRLIPGLVAIALSVSLLSAPAAMPAAEPVADFTAASVSTAHPYGNPQWYPLRTSDMNEWIRLDKPAGTWSSTIGCTWGNEGCKAGQPASHGGEDYHPYFALDFNADKGDDVYSAGWGIFRVGAASAPCVTGDAVGTRGIWGWVDHGGGVTSRYHHLNSISTELDGKLVGPDTKIGTVGISGSKCDAKINYLHFAVTKNDVDGQHTNPGNLRACQNGGELSYPRDMRAAEDDWKGAAGYLSWLGPDYRQDAFPWGDNSCIPDQPATPDIVTTPRGVRGNQTASLSWSDPSRPAGALTIEMQVWAPSINDWAATNHYRYLSGSARSYKWTGLANGRTYRFRVAYRNGAGHAGWSGWREVIPAAPPGVPRHNASYPQAGKTNIRYAWKKSYEYGAPVTSYVVARRHKVRGVWSRWSTYKVGPDTYYIRWDGLVSRREYGMRVLARSAVGPSGWKRVSTITTLR